MAPASNPPAISSRGSSARVTRARTVASVKKAGIDSSVTALALGTGHAPVREVNVCVWMCARLGSFVKIRIDYIMDAISKAEPAECED